MPEHDQTPADDGIQRHVMEQRRKRLQIALIQHPELAQAEPFANIDRFTRLREEVIAPTMRNFGQTEVLKTRPHHIVVDNDHVDEALAVVGAGIRLILCENALPNGINLYEIPTLSFYHDRLEQKVQCRVEIYDSSRNGDERLVQCPDIETPLEFDAATVAAIVTKLKSFMEALERHSS